MPRDYPVNNALYGWEEGGCAFLQRDAPHVSWEVVWLIVMPVMSD